MSRKKKIVLWAAFFCVLMGCAGFLIGVKSPSDICVESLAQVPGWVKKDLKGYSDDFSSINPRWNFGDIERSGYHRLVKDGGLSAAEIGIGPVDRYGDSDCSLEETVPVRRAGLMTIRAKLADKLEDFKGGTFGFGLWNNRDGYHFDAVWFVGCSKASSKSLYGFSAMITDESRIVFAKPVTVDVNAWHVYSIEIKKERTVFYIDGAEVARAEGINAARTCKGVVAWVDNKTVNVYKTNHKIQYIDVPQNCSMLIDSISWRPFT